MIDGDALADVLHAISTGFPDRALNIIVTSPKVEDPIRQSLYAAVNDRRVPAEQAIALGDFLRDARADQALINECYRCAFYLGTAWAELVDDPIYAHFAANRAGPVLDKWIHYFPIYSHHLDKYRGRSVRVLEIGVYRGGSLDMWQRYLGPKACLVGLDIDEASVRAVNGRYPVVLGDQEDPAVLRELEERHGPFDIIIDDGGHAMRQQIVSVEALFPLLKEGGTYIVEDCHTSYWREFGGRLRDPSTFIEWSKRRVDDMHWRHCSDIDRSTVWATHLSGMHVYDSLVVLDKKERFRPFNEVVGTSSYLFAGRFSEVVGVELLATRDAAILERDQLRDYVRELEAGEDTADHAAAVAQAHADVEELRLARAELQRSRERLNELTEQLELKAAEADATRNELLESWAQLNNLRGTLSWRVTSPLRAARRLTSR